MGLIRGRLRADSDPGVADADHAGLNVGDYHAGGRQNGQKARVERGIRTFPYSYLAVSAISALVCDNFFAQKIAYKKSLWRFYHSDKTA